MATHPSLDALLLDPEDPQWAPLPQEGSSSPTPQEHALALSFSQLTISPATHLPCVSPSTTLRGGVSTPSVLPTRKLRIRQASGGLGPGWPFSKVLVLQDHVPALPPDPDPSCHNGCQDSRRVPNLGSQGNTGYGISPGAPAPPAHLCLVSFGGAPEGLAYN